MQIKKESLARGHISLLRLLRCPFIQINWRLGVFSSQDRIRILAKSTSSLHIIAIILTNRMFSIAKDLEHHIQRNTRLRQFSNVWQNHIEDHTADFFPIFLYTHTHTHIHTNKRLITLRAIVHARVHSAWGKCKVGIEEIYAVHSSELTSGKTNEFLFLKNKL